MSALVDDAIAKSGFADLAFGRDGSLDASDMARLRAADLLVLGALADRVRQRDLGPEVRIYLNEAPADAGLEGDLVVLPPDEEELTGLELLREVAIARIAGAPGRRVRIDWVRAGLELAQVALGFGASELTGRFSNKRGLPLAEGELAGVGKKSRREPAHRVKQKELAGLVRRAGREPRFMGSSFAPDVEET